MAGKENEGMRERQTGRQTNRQRQTDRQADRERDRGTDRETERQTEIQTDRHRQSSQLYYSRTEILGNSLFLQFVLEQGRVGGKKERTKDHSHTYSPKAWAEFSGCIKWVLNDQSLQWQSLQNLSICLSSWR